jgi:hypothetical protein
MLGKSGHHRHLGQVGLKHYFAVRKHVFPVYKLLDVRLLSVQGQLAVFWYVHLLTKIISFMYYC